MLPAGHASSGENQLCLLLTCLRRQVPPHNGNVPAADGDDGDVFIRITNREIWLTLNKAVEEVRGMRADQKAVLDASSDVSKRVRALELRFYGILAGLISALVFGIGALIHILNS